MNIPRKWIAYQIIRIEKVLISKSISSIALKMQGAKRELA